MKEATRKWLEDLATIKNNSKAIQIIDYIIHLENELNRVREESPHEDTGNNNAQPMNANSALFNGYGG